jgi:hypothetical protein
VRGAQSSIASTAFAAVVIAVELNELENAAVPTRRFEIGNATASERKKGEVMKKVRFIVLAFYPLCGVPCVAMLSCVYCAIVFVCM